MNFFSLFKRKIIFKFKSKISIDDKNQLNDSLDDLFHYYGSDKANIFKINNTKGHGYSKFYVQNLNDLKKNNFPKKILELGSFAGASAASFTKYLDNTKVFCFDINISNFKYSSKNIHVYGVDANNKKKNTDILSKIYKKFEFNKFDIIIEDGSHYLSDMINNLNFFFKHLKNGGIFVIEDFKHPNYYEYNKDINHILFDKLLDNLKNKIYFKSDLLTDVDQKYLMDNIVSIDIYKGNLKDSHICFIKKVK